MPSSNLSDALSTVSTASRVPIWIPSLGKTVLFRPLNGEDRKKLVASAANGPIAVLTITAAVTDIIRAASAEPEFNFDACDIYDRMAIAIQLKANICQGKMSKSFALIDPEATENDVKTLDVDLNDHITKNKESYTPFSPIPVGENGYEFVLALPSVKCDMEFNQYMEDCLRRMTAKSAKDAFKTISVIVELFGHIELASYIEHIQVGDVNISMDQFTPAERISIINKIPWELIVFLRKRRKELFDARFDDLYTISQEVGKKSYASAFDYGSLFLD